MLSIFRIVRGRVLAPFLLCVIFALPPYLLWLIFNSQDTPSEIEKSILALDRTPPTPPRTDPISDRTENGYVIIKGNSEANSKVKVFKDYKLTDTFIVGDTSTFSIKVGLDYGENKIWFIATDKAGNESENSAVLPIIFEK